MSDCGSVLIAILYTCFIYVQQSVKLSKINYEYTQYF